jgi:O-antigen ligase
MMGDTDVMWRTAFAGAVMAAFAVYVAIATMATLFVPPSIIIFLAPFVLIAIAAAPQRRAVPKKIITAVMLGAVALMPVWPTYIHLKFGPMPLLTPPRVLFYFLTAFWLYDMAASPLRRGQFAFAMKRGGWLSISVIGFFALNAISVPIAEGSKFAGIEFFRQVIIWLLPFCACATYVRRWADFKRILAALAVGAAIVGAIAVAEFATSTLLAAKLSPFIMADTEWLRIAQEVKSRDGVFRAQATHTHPISLGEYLSFGAPLALAFAIAARRRRRLIWGAVLLIILCGVAATNSRGAIFSLAVSLGLTGGLFAFQLMRKVHLFRVRPLVGLGSLFLILGSPVILVAAHQTVTGAAGASAARSSQGRIDQIKLAWPKIIKRPVGGHGTGRSARIVGYYGRALSLDNYYLSLAVDLGFPGPISFLGILGLAIASSLKRAKMGPPEMHWALIGFAAALASFGISRMIISQTGNISFLFPVVGAYLGAMAASAPRRKRHASGGLPVNMSASVSLSHCEDENPPYTG